MTSVVIHGYLDSGPLIGCVSLTFTLLTQTQTHMIGDTPKILSRNYWHKKVNYLEAFIEQRRHFTLLVFSVDGAMGEWVIKVTTNQLDSSLSKNGTWNTWQHVVMSWTVSP